MLASHASKMAREDAVTAALRAANDAIGDERPTPQALRIIAAIKQLRTDEPARVISAKPVDYLSRVQNEARGQWYAKHGFSDIGPAHDISVSIDTPLGPLSLTAWRRQWGGKKPRIAWAGEYSLNGAPITIAAIKDAGLAQKRFTRSRKRTP